MKLWNRLVLGSLVLALALGVCVGPAAAASKKKKETKKEEEHHSAARHMEKRYVSGTNTMARPGLLYGDTSEVAPVGGVEGSAMLTYSSPASGFSNVGVPFGAHFGAAENVDLFAAGVLNFFSAPSITVPGFGTVGGGSSSNFAVDLGGKYKIRGANSETPDFSVGGDILIPTSGGNAIFTPWGTITYVLTSGLLLNGDMGIHISNGTYVSFDAGAGLPFSDKLTGIAEIGANQAGNGGSVLAGGVRADLDKIKLQALLGIPLNGGGVVIGGGIILASY